MVRLSNDLFALNFISFISIFFLIAFRGLLTCLNEHRRVYLFLNTHLLYLLVQAIELLVDHKMID